MVVIALSWSKNEKSIWKSFLFTALTCAIFYLNSPNFLSVIEGTKLKNNFFSWPFTLYSKWGTAYIIVTNLSLTLIGLYLGKNSNNKFNSWSVKKQFDYFVLDATNLKVIGRDLDFLLDDGNERYRVQREKIRSLGNHASLLCSRTNDINLIELYHDLLKAGTRIRAYASRNGITNLKGQIKVDGNNKKSSLFVLKSLPSASLFNKFQFDVDAQKTPNAILKLFHIMDQSNLFEILRLENGYLLDAVNQQFDKIFSNSLHPVIRCIALDLGGVYFDGDIDLFYKYLWDKHKISIAKRRKDRLNIDEHLMLGEITIRDFICQRSRSQTAIEKLSEKDWENILDRWQDIWHPNQKMRQIVQKLGELGYTIIPFSNLDLQNGEKYVRDHYLPECCTSYYFSYERKKSKPSKDAFEDFVEFVTKKGYIQKPYQILLIDDEKNNLDVAREFGWETLSFYNNPLNDSIALLIQNLKQMSILPENYSV